MRSFCHKLRESELAKKHMETQRSLREQHIGNVPYQNLFCGYNTTSSLKRKHYVLDLDSGSTIIDHLEHGESATKLSREFNVGK